MGRNLDRRIETVFPINDPTLKKYIKEQIIDMQLSDNVKARVLQNDGSWILRKPGNNPPLNFQQWCIDNPREFGPKLEPASTSTPLFFF